MVTVTDKASPAERFVQPVTLEESDTVYILVVTVPVGGVNVGPVATTVDPRYHTGIMLALVTKLKVSGLAPKHSNNGLFTEFEITGGVGGEVTVIVPFVDVEAEHCVVRSFTVTEYTPAAFTDKVLVVAPVILPPLLPHW